MERIEPKTESEIRERVREAFGERFEGASLGNFDAGNFTGVVNWLKNPKGILLIYGGPGSGKTHFAAAVFGYLYNTFRHKRIYKEAEIFRKLFEGFGTNANSNSIEYLRRMIDDEFIIVDDLGSMGTGESGWKETMLFELVDYRYSSRKPTMFTTNLNHSEFSQTYNPRIASRLFAKENVVINSGNVDLRQEGK